MRIVTVEESVLREVSNFITEHKLIWHPRISPTGVPDFTKYKQRRFVLSTDRHIHVKLIRLLERGYLKDRFDRKLVSALLIWSEFNRVGISPLFALSEGESSNMNIDRENSIIQSIFSQYEIEAWIGLFCGSLDSIEICSPQVVVSAEIYSDNSHYKLHYASMLKVVELWNTAELNRKDKLLEFLQWNYDNTLMCRYTNMLVTLLFSGHSKQCKVLTRSGKEVLDMCENQAWDLTNLSLWSMLYSTEEQNRPIPLFCTNDKELKKIISAAQSSNFEIFENGFGKSETPEILEEINRIVIPRDPKNLDELDLDTIITELEETVFDLYEI